MSTLEHTLSMVKTLPEADLLQVQQLIKKLQHRRTSKHNHPTLTREQFLDQLKLSEKQIQNGECMEMGPAIQEIRLKHGL